MNKQVIILIEEDPQTSTFNEVAEMLGLKGIDPLNFIEPESHMLSTIYKDVFTNDTANGLMGYLIHKHDGPIVYEVFAAVQEDTERLTLVNTTLLTKEDIRFLSSTLPNVLTYKLNGDARGNATDIYDGSKSYRDKIGI